MAAADPPLSPARRRAFWLFLAAFVAFVVYGVAVAWRATLLYGDVKRARRGWHGRLYEAHPELGFRPIPGASGVEFAPDLESPVRIDGDGLRVPVTGPAERRRPYVLALGCSFTYGAACLAEEAYAFHVAQGLGGTALNAGAGGYGLGQMVLRARDLVPRLRPEYVILQYADWLVQRGQSPFAPSFVGLVSSPYVSRARPGGAVDVEAAPFQTRLFDLPVGEYRGGSKGVGDFLSFTARVALPLYLHDDASFAAWHARTATGLARPPLRDGDAVVAWAYGEMSGIARAHGARVVVVTFGPPPQGARLSHLEAAGTVVNAQPVLLAALAGGTAAPDAYLRAYGHWRGSPPRLVDPHPNARAHALVAAAVLRAIGGPAGADAMMASQR